MVGILLAGGASQRFGGDKLLQPLADGVPVAEASARSLLAVCPTSLVVLRPQQAILAGLLQRIGCQVRFDAKVADGMGSSLACGVRASPAAAGWLVALADMPFVQLSTLRLVVDALAGGAQIVAPVYRGRRGHPVGFAASWHGALAALSGDTGARRLITTHSAMVTYLDVDDPGVVRDIDRQTDLPPQR